MALRYDLRWPVHANKYTESARLDQVSGHVDEAEFYLREWLQLSRITRHPELIKARRRMVESAFEALAMWLDAFRIVWSDEGEPGRGDEFIPSLWTGDEKHYRHSMEAGFTHGVGLESVILRDHAPGIRFGWQGLSQALTLLAEVVRDIRKAIDDDQLGPDELARFTDMQDWFSRKYRQWLAWRADTIDTPKKSPYSDPKNYERNLWLLAQRDAGETIPCIMADLETRTEWEPLFSENGIRDAIESIAIHLGRDKPRGKAGRPRKHAHGKPANPAK